MTFSFLVQFVRKIGEETGQTSEESFRFARFQFMHKFPDIKGGIGGCDRSIERGDKIEETIFHLFVRKPQRICTKTLVERLYSQVSALINHRNGIGDIRPVVAQGGGRDFNTVQFAKVKICLL